MSFLLLYESLKKKFSATLQLSGFIAESFWSDTYDTAPTLTVPSTSTGSSSAGGTVVFAPAAPTNSGNNNWIWYISAVSPVFVGTNGPTVSVGATNVNAVTTQNVKCIGGSGASRPIGTLTITLTISIPKPATGGTTTDYTQTMTITYT